MIPRRSFLLGAVLVACKRKERCRHCGMVVERANPWTSELLLDDGATVFYDTPRCALTAWRTKKVFANGMRVREYYDAKGPMRDASTLRFVVGGDVQGPMGPDFVPVEPGRVSKFIQDHGADRAYTLEEISAEVLLK
jgi:hypothetical protein